MAPGQSSSTSARPIAGLRGRRLLVAAVLFGGAVLSTVGALAVRQWDRAAAESAFQASAQERIAAVRRELEADLEALYGVRALFDSTDVLGPQDFSRYARELLSRRTSLRSVSWSPRIRADQRDALEQAMRAAGHPEFTICQRDAAGQLVPAAPRGDAIVTCYAEPPQTAAAILGFDHLSEPARAEAIGRAQQSGAAAASAATQLISGAPGQLGVAVYLPVSDRGDPPGGGPGLVAGMIEVGSVVDAALSALPARPYTIVVRDASSTPAAVLTTRSNDQGHPDALSLSRQIDVGGRRWEVTCTTHAWGGFAAGWEPWGILAGGLLATGLLALNLAAATGRARIQRLVEEHSAELERERAALAAEVAERQRSEAALRDSEARYRRIVETADEGVWVADAQWHTSFVNPRMASLLGYEPGQMIGRPITDFLDDEGRQEVKDRWARRVLGQTERYDLKIRRADGSHLWTMLSASPIMDEQGRFLGSLAMVTDVTQRRRTEEEARDIAAMLRLVTDALPVYISYVGADGRYRWVNRMYEEWFQRPREQIIGHTPQEIQPGDAYEAMRPYVERALAGERVHYENRLTSPDGSAAILDTQYLPHTGAGGAVLGFFVLVSDVTDRVRAAEFLRDRRWHLERAQQVAHIGSWVADARQDGALWWSPETCRIFGVPEEQFDGRGATFYAHIHPDDRERVAAAVDAALNGGTPYSIDLRILRAGGEERWVHTEAEVERDASGRPLRMIGVVQDITERRHAEEALRHSEATTRALLDAVPDLMFRMDRHGRYLDYHAPNLADLLVPPERFMGRTAAEVLPPRLAELCMAALDRVFETGQPQVYEYDFVRDPAHAAAGTGRRRYWEVRVVRCGADEAMLLVRDVSQSRLDAIRLRDSERRLSLLIRQSPLAIIVWTPSLRIAEWNPAAERIFGFAAAEVIGRDATPLVPHAAREHVDRIGAFLAETHGSERSTTENLTKDGRVILCDWSNTAMVGDDGAFIGVASIVQDVTEQKHAEEALRKSEERYRQLFESNMDAILIADDQGRIVGANAAACALLAEPRERVLEMSIRDLATPAGPDWLNAEFRRLIAAGAAAGELELVRTDGQRRTVEYAARRVAPEQNMLILRDITERRQAERRQRMMMAELDHRVKNNLAAVLALAEQSVRGAKSLEAFGPAFVGRLRAMARMHTALAHGRWEGAPLRQLVRQSLEAYMLRTDTAGLPGERSERIVASGPDVILPARAVSPMAMALHELATNAAKYGALSAAGGRVHVRWDVEPGPDGLRSLRLEWVESGGPPVTPPSSRGGFGSELIRGGIAYELRGEVTLEYPPTGVRCLIHLPLEEPAAQPAPTGPSAAS